ncbi:MAG: LPS-assembly protein LptD [Steroidobacteraceae bacterium]
MTLPTLLHRALLLSLLYSASQPAAWAFCADDSPPSPQLPGSVAGQEIHFDAAQATYGTDGKAEFTGPVTVRMGDRLFEAENKVTYDENSNDLRIFGQMDYRDPTLHVKGDSGSYGDEGGQFHDADFEFLQQAGRGHASEVDTDVDGKVLQLTRAIYTTCPADRADWQLRARQVTLDTNTMRGTGRGASVIFKGVPVIYLPWISFPLSNARQTGLLFPTLGNSSRSGLSVTAPWYWNLAPNYDLTLAPTIYTERGLDLGGEFRYLGTASTTNVQASFMPRDQDTGTQRAHVKLDERLALPAGWRVDLNAEQVSDMSYLEDFGDGTQISSTPFLAQSARLGYRDDTWLLALAAQHLQTLDSTLADSDHPYVELPSLTANALWSSDNRLLQWGFDSDATNFWRADSVDGWRAHARPQVGLDITEAGYYLRPNVAWDSTYYQLTDNTTADASTYSVSRNLPVLSFDTGMQFERLAGAKGQRSVTLEPRLLYVYIPYRDQSQLPVFDSSTSDINLTELFDTNRYVGLDRIGDANQVTLGLTTRMFSTASGTRYLSASFGQRYYFAQPRVTLPDETASHQSRSDLVGQIDLTGFYNWNVQTSMAWDPSQSRAEKSQVNLQYIPATDKVANFGYRFQRGSLEQVDASLAWPIAKRWDLYGRSVYSLRDDASVEHFAGFQFRGDCWGLRFVARRSVSRRTGEMDNGFYLQLELNGLSSVGTGADSFLERSIRGYSASSSSL